MNLEMGYFKELAQQYRIEQQAEVTPYAVKYAYQELKAGRKTALIQKIEQMLGVGNLAELTRKTALKPEIERERPARRTIAPLHKDRGIDYAHPDMLKLILDPKFNLATKTDTAKYTLDQGKVYFIAMCQKHGSTLQRAIETKAQRNHKNDKRIVNYCVSCGLKAGVESTYRRINEISALVETILSQGINSELAG